MRSGAGRGGAGRGGAGRGGAGRGSLPLTPGLIPYMGGKSKHAGRIASLLPPHHCYVEPFAGGLAVLRAKAPSPIEIVNDLDGELIHFYKQAAFRGAEVLAAIEILPLSRRLFVEFLRADPLYLSPIWRAARTYYLLAHSFAGKAGTFSVHPAKMPHRFRRDVLEAFRARTSRVVWESMDALALIERYDSPTTAFYVDPPYLGKDWYAQKFGGATRHAALRDQLAACRGRWLLSHHDTPAIRTLYQGFHLITLPVRYAIATGAKRPVKELLIANYPLKKPMATAPVS